MLKFIFGYEIEKIEKVESYVRDNCSKYDYECIVQRGEDVMNCLYIKSKCLNDELRQLLKDADCYVERI